MVHVGFIDNNEIEIDELMTLKHQIFLLVLFMVEGVREALKQVEVDCYACQSWF
jgi:uncharacterized protein Smg (DUF494 family)